MPPKTRRRPRADVVRVGGRAIPRTRRKLSLRKASNQEVQELAALVELRELLLRGSCSDLSPLAALEKLQRLDVEHTGVSDLSPLAGLPLRTLLLSNTSVADLSAFGTLTDLRVLNLGRTTITDLTPLGGLTQLRSLDVDESAVVDISPLCRCPALEFLLLNETAVADLSPLRDLPALAHVELTSCPAVDLEPLKTTPLRYLDLDEVQAKALPSRAWPQLTHLILDHSAITKIDTLHAAPKLQELSLRSTSIGDLTPLTAAHELRVIRLDDTPVTDLRPLHALPTLESVVLTRTRASPDEIDALRQAQPRAIIYNVPRR